jgi:hypothetical protein
MELLIPGWMLLLAVGIGGAVGGFFIVVLVWRTYSRTDMARHNHMARMIKELRRKHNDYSDISGEDVFSDGNYSLTSVRTTGLNNGREQVYTRRSPSMSFNSQIQQNLILWAKRVLVALGEVPELGKFSIESKHSPYPFRIINTGSDGLIHLYAYDNLDEQSYSPNVVCHLDLPAWIIRDLPVSVLESKVKGVEAPKLVCTRSECPNSDGGDQGLSFNFSTRTCTLCGAAAREVEED